MSDQVATLIEHVLIALINAAAVVITYWHSRRHRGGTPHRGRGDKPHTD